VRLEGIERRADGGRNPLGLSQDHLEVLAQAVVRGEALETQLGPAGDDVERSADLVGEPPAETTGGRHRLRP